MDEADFIDKFWKRRSCYKWPLKNIFDVLINELCYALLAWEWFLTVDLSNGIEGLLKTQTMWLFKENTYLLRKCLLRCRAIYLLRCRDQAPSHCINQLLTVCRHLETLRPCGHNITQHFLIQFYMHCISVCVCAYITFNKQYSTLRLLHTPSAVESTSASTLTRCSEATPTTSTKWSEWSSASASSVHLQHNVTSVHKNLSAHVLVTLSEVAN